MKTHVQANILAGGIPDFVRENVDRLATKCLPISNYEGYFVARADTPHPSTLRITGEVVVETVRYSILVGVLEK